MKIAIITDQHFGARKNSKLFHDYFLKFYNDIFFPYLEEHGITTIVDMGDTFDSRKGIDFSALSWAKNNYYDRLADMGIHIHTIVGNHTAYYKNTNEVNAVDLLLREYDNVTTYSKATEVVIDKLNVLFIPWINQENEEETLKLIQSTTSSCAMGHLELTGFRAHKNLIMDHGMESELYQKFNKVFSGHYHTRSNDGRIFYIGNPYEMFWNDVNDDRGFIILDTDDMEFEYVNNPFRMFHNIYYDDTPYQMFDSSPYHNKIVKIIVKSKNDITNFEKFVDKIYETKVADLKIVESYDFNNGYFTENPDVETEDTFSILNRYIEEAEFSLDKSVVQSLIKDVYEEACELV